MAVGKILVVDDDPNLIELVKMRLESAGYDVTAAIKEEDAIGAVRSEPVDLCLLDLMLENRDGISLMEEVHAITPDIPAIILTAHGTIGSAVEAMRKGAYSYLTKPFEAQDLLLQIERALEHRRLNFEIKRLKSLIEEKYDFANIIARSAKMRSVLDMVTRIAKTDSTVYINGESGTGKELIAKAIHLASDRKDESFVAINCAAIPETLLESELFGHEKGAFTGAVKSTKGLFTQANHGTLFLDEIGDMPLSIQVKLLRALEERQFYPVGGEKPVQVDVRVVVATKKDLVEEVKKGSFREDLFYRIHVIPIVLPPLKERLEDIPYLVDHLLRKICQQMKRDVKGLTPKAMEKLMQHDWPGNVRELENTLEFAVTMTQRDVITDDLVLQTKIPTTPVQTEDPVQAQLLPVNGSFKTLKEARSEFEKAYLVRLLRSCNGKATRAAEIE